MYAAQKEQLGRRPPADEHHPRAVAHDFRNQLREFAIWECPRPIRGKWRQGPVVVEEQSAFRSAANLLEKMSDILMFGNRHFAPDRKIAYSRLFEAASSIMCEEAEGPLDQNKHLRK
jgi:hypothetical protein